MVIHSAEPVDFPGKLYPLWQIELEEGDRNLDIDYQGYE